MSREYFAKLKYSKRFPKETTDAIIENKGVGINQKQEESPKKHQNLLKMFKKFSCHVIVNILSCLVQLTP
ncbi:hypothetical protein RFI_36132 [Reticulomyxa filosa]|uniref:Uncharacterized protein n=1 Tax=Reticulomyxa filosa TaxID=46433 RepID=X6LH60_RETFI|nr:hypothetical protein RFI_36132 [Reticulomyxa filosa]|eukprot:ETO01308.1 hypothetical protein RFI_36132 [Reticulomyxa filosa]